MSINPWDIMQTIFISWLASSLIVVAFVVLVLAEYPKVLKSSIILAIIVCTIITLIGGFLYYKNMETKCMYDIHFRGPCIEKNLS
jgi:hypothetical protein